MSRASEIRRQEVVVLASYVGSCGFELGPERDSFNSHCFGLSSLRKESLGRARRRWEDNIKMDLTEMKWEGVGLTDLRTGTCCGLL